MRGEDTRIVSIDHGDSVAVLKSRVQDAFGVAAEFQVLAHNGKVLDCSLNNVRDGATLSLSMRLRGGRGDDTLLIDTDLSVELYSEDIFRKANMMGTQDFCLSEDLEDEHDDSKDIICDYAKDDCELATVEAMFRTVLDDNGEHQPANDEQGEASRKRKLEADPATSAENGSKSPKTAKAAKSQSGKSGKRGEGKSKRGAANMVPFVPAMYPIPFSYHPSGGYFPVMPPPLMQRRPKGVAYDLDCVDEKLKKRLLKNRQSAERSRQKKNDTLKNLEEQLQDAHTEIEDLKKELEDGNGTTAGLRAENEEMRALLCAHGIPLPPHLA